MTPPISVTKLVVEEPSCNPIGSAILSGRKIPIIARVLISTKGDLVYCFILPLLLEIVPVVRWLTRTVIFQVRLLRD